MGIIFPVKCFRFECEYVLCVSELCDNHILPHPFFYIVIVTKIS